MEMRLKVSLKEKRVYNNHVYMILVLDQHNESPILLAHELGQLTFLYGEKAPELIAMLKDGFDEESYAIILNDKPYDASNGIYLAFSNLEETKEKMMEMLDKGIGAVLLDLSTLEEDKLEETIKEIRKTFYYDAVILALPSCFVGEKLELCPQLKKPLLLHEEKKYQDVYENLYDDILEIKHEKVEEEGLPERRKKAVDEVEETTLPLFDKRQKKDLAINIAFSCFFQVLCLLLPVVTLTKEDTNETLMVISTIIGFIFSGFSCFPFVSSFNAQRKKGNVHMPSHLILIAVHTSFSFFLAALLAGIATANNWNNIVIAYILFIAICPLFTIAYAAFFALIHRPKKEKNPA